MAISASTPSFYASVPDAQMNKNMSLVEEFGRQAVGSGLTYDGL